VLPPTLAAPTGIGNLSAVSRFALISPAVGATATGATAAGVTTPAPSATLLTLCALWLAGAVVAAVFAVRGRLAACAAVRGAPAPAWMQRTAASCAQRLGLRRCPPLVIARALPGACVQGLLRPVIALPPRVARDELEPLLLHELAHVRRRDLWCDAALSALCVVFWFHPAAWLARARLAQLRELCCDEVAVAALGPRAGAYRATLLRAAARLVGEPAPQPGFLGGTSQLVLRLRSLERGPARHPSLRAATTPLVTLLLAACALPMARHASTYASDAARLAAARGLIASAFDGSSRPGCIRLHYAAMLVAADPSPDSHDAHGTHDAPDSPIP
jgi:beta-lactamase regulating signal transducer with metallopeptidase domain